jgi:NAD(P)H-dependent FMN reductase
VPTLQIIIGSTRPGRSGPSIAEWYADAAKQTGLFDLEIVDLAEVNLPLFDEPLHPRLGQYEHEHTKRWSEIVQRGDAYVFVVPEYNYGFNAATKNAIDYLHDEWKHKPVSFVSYGGVAAGTRAVQMLKQVVTTLSMMPIFESVNIPFHPQFFDEEGRFVANEVLEASAESVTRELARWTESTATLRA